MSQPTIQVPKEASVRDCATQAKAPPMPTFSTELMKMLAQLVMLR